MYARKIRLALQVRDANRGAAREAVSGLHHHDERLAIERPMIERRLGAEAG
jgi:hypothetical protein